MKYIIICYCKSLNQYFLKVELFPRNNSFPKYGNTCSFFLSADKGYNFLNLTNIYRLSANTL